MIHAVEFLFYFVTKYYCSGLEFIFRDIGDYFELNYKFVNKRKLYFLCVNGKDLPYTSAIQAPIARTIKRWLTFKDWSFILHFRPPHCLLR